MRKTNCINIMITLIARITEPHHTHTHTHNKKKKRNSAFDPLSTGSFLIMCNTVTHSTIQYSTIQYSTVTYSTVQCSTVTHSTVQYSTVQYSNSQYSNSILYSSKSSTSTILIFFSSLTKLRTRE